MEIVKINNKDLQVKTWNGQRVVTLADIDRVQDKLAVSLPSNILFIPISKIKKLIK